MEYLKGNELYSLHDLINLTNMGNNLCLWDEGNGEYFSFRSPDGNSVSFKDALEELIKLKRQMYPFESDPSPLKGVLYRYGIPYKK